MSKKLLIILLNTDPANPSELGTPFFQAIVAAAMGYEVEMVFTGRAGELVKKGVAENLYPQEGNQRSLFELILEAKEVGIRLVTCSPTQELWGDELIDELDEMVGGAYLIAEAMADNTVTFTY